MIERSTAFTTARSDAWRAWHVGPSLAYEVYLPRPGDPRPWPYHVIDAFTARTGRPMRPPAWSFGPRRRFNRFSTVDGESELAVMRERDLAITTVDDAAHFFPAGSHLGGEDELRAWTAAAGALAAARGMERRQLAKVSLAEAHRANGDIATSERLLREVLAEMPRSPIALHGLGSLYLEKGERLDEAVELIKKALTIDQKNAEYLNSLGLVYLKLGRLPEAERNLRSAARLDAGSPSIYEHLGDLLKEKNELHAAETSWQRALRLSIDPIRSDRLRRKIGN